MRVAGKAAHANDEALPDDRGEADLGAEFVADPRLALGDAIELGFVQPSRPPKQAGPALGPKLPLDPELCCSAARPGAATRACNRSASAARVN